MYTTKLGNDANELICEAGYCLVIEYNDTSIKAYDYKDGIFVDSWCNLQLGTDCIVQSVFEQVLKENDDSLRDTCISLYNNGYSYSKVDKIVRLTLLRECERAIYDCFMEDCDFFDIDFNVNRLLGERIASSTNYISYYGSLSEIAADYREQLKVEMEKLSIEVTRANDYHYLERVIMTGNNSYWWRKLIQDVFCEQECAQIHLLSCK